MHRYPNWAIEMKNIYDDLPDLKVIYTGSSLLELYTYDMPGLSFREFLEFELKQSFDPLPLSDLINDHVGIAAEIISQIKGLSNAYLVKDQIEIGTGNSIPLWLFGFLY